MKKIYFLLSIPLLFCMGAFSQTVVLTPTNATNWSGSVIPDNTIATPSIVGVSTTATTGARGFARFDLSSIPTTAVISSATMRLTTATGTVSSASTLNEIRVTNTNTLTPSGLFAALAGGTQAWSGSWAGTAPVTFNMAFSSGGLSALKSLCTGNSTDFVTMGIIRGSTNSYNFTGSDGVATNVPQLTIIYTIPSTPPSCASGFVPANLATGISRNPTLSWTAASGATSYDVYFGTSSTPPLIGNQVGTTYAPILSASTTYYWKIVSKNNIGDATGCVTNSFTTGLYLTYCTTGLYSTGCGLGDPITNVTFAGINNTTACSASPFFTFYPTPIGSPVPVGSGTSISISNGDPDDRVKVWIDLNDNGIYDNTTELFFNQKGSSVSGAITLPLSAPLGTHNMRVRNVWMSTSAEPEAGFTACSAQQYGETEDYLITVTAAATCINPTGLVASAVTFNSATLSWSAVPSATNGYIYSFGISGTPPALPTSGTATTATSFNATMLTPLTTYFFHVLSDCGSGSNSTWSTTSFTTPIDCSTAATLTCGTAVTPVFAAGAGVWNFSGTNPTNSCGAATAGIEKIYKFAPTLNGIHYINVTANGGSAVDFLIKEASLGCSDMGYTCVGTSLSTGLKATPALVAGTVYFIVADPELSTGTSTITFNIDCPTPPPVCTTNSSPAAMATNVAVPVVFTWNSASNATSYDLYVGTTNPPTTTIATNITGTTFTWNGALPNTTYFWFVTPKNTFSSATGCDASATQFTTSNPPANDNCANATPLTIGVGSCQTPLLGTLALANNTTGLADPTCISSIYAADVWYSVTVQPGKTINVEMYAVKASGNDLGLQAYTGDCSALPGSLITKLCNDDGNPLLGPSALMPSMVLSNTGIIDSVYLLRVVPYSTIANASAFSICAWENFAVTPPVATTTNCVNVAINFDSARKYMDVPVFDAGGNIIATIYPNGNIMGNTIVSYNVNTGTVRRDDLGVYVLDRNITITPTTQPSTTLPVQVRAYIKGTEVLTLDAADPAAVTTASLVVSKYNTNVCTNMLPPSIATLITPTSSTYGASDAFVQFNTNSFSTFYFHGGLVPLANSSVEAFTATKLGNTALVNWKVAAINNTVSYQVMKSTDGRNFISIANVTAVASQRSYNSTDANLANGANYYKLKATDRNGVVSFSNVAVVYNNTKGFEIVSLIPTLVNGSALASIGSNVAQNATLVVTDMQGKIVYKKQIGLQAGTTDVMVDATKFAIGTYVLHAVIANGNSNKVRFIKQ